jgi:hypothetical protein
MAQDPNEQITILHTINFADNIFGKTLLKLPAMAIEKVLLGIKLALFIL